jgi:large subunit ribosomal protein L24
MAFTTSWNRSTQVRKQRKYRYNAPLHIKQKLLSVHLSADLRKKYGARNITVRSGDKVKVMRGQFAKKEGKVDRINLKDEKVFIAGIEIVKKEGAKIGVGFNPSNLQILELDLSDKKRKEKLEGKSQVKSDKKETKPVEKKIEKVKSNES